jgi:hypothetical protein
MDTFTFVVRVFLCLLALVYSFLGLFSKDKDMGMYNFIMAHLSIILSYVIH